jgi:hypothetical protein
VLTFHSQRRDFCHRHDLVIEPTSSHCFAFQELLVYETSCESDGTRIRVGCRKWQNIALFVAHGVGRPLVIYKTAMIHQACRSKSHLFIAPRLRQPNHPHLLHHEIDIHFHRSTGITKSPYRVGVSSEYGLQCDFHASLAARRFEHRRVRDPYYHHSIMYMTHRVVTIP